MPGGAGFEPHQDISAGWWMYGQSIHISALVTVDEATPANGCLEVVYGKHKAGKLGPDWKAIPEDVCRQLDVITSFFASSIKTCMSLLCSWWYGMVWYGIVGSITNKAW
jgi:hypothetical protein